MPHTPDDISHVSTLVVGQIKQDSRSDNEINGDGSTSLSSSSSSSLLSYVELLDFLADQCDGMSGASLAGVARAAASHALERSVCDYSERVMESMNGANGDAGVVLECLVTQRDFDLAVQDVISSSGDTDWSDDDTGKSEENDDTSSSRDR